MHPIEPNTPRSIKSVLGICEGIAAGVVRTKPMPTSIRRGAIDSPTCRKGGGRDCYLPKRVSRDGQTPIQRPVVRRPSAVAGQDHDDGILLAQPNLKCKDTVDRRAKRATVFSNSVRPFPPALRSIDRRVEKPQRQPNRQKKSLYLAVDVASPRKFPVARTDTANDANCYSGENCSPKYSTVPTDRLPEPGEPHKTPRKSAKFPSSQHWCGGNDPSSRRAPSSVSARSLQHASAARLDRRNSP